MFSPPDRAGRRPEDAEGEDVGLPSELSQALTEGLRQVSDRVESQFDTLAARVFERLDLAAADLRRGLVAAQEVQADAAVQLTSIAADTQLSLESRTNILEQALSAHVRRAEATQAVIMRILDGEQTTRADAGRPQSASAQERGEDLERVLARTEARLRRAVQKSVNEAVKEIGEVGFVELRAEVARLTYALDRLSSRSSSATTTGPNAPTGNVRPQKTPRKAAPDGAATSTTSGTDKSSRSSSAKNSSTKNSVDRAPAKRAPAKKTAAKKTAAKKTAAKTSNPRPRKTAAPER